VGQKLADGCQSESLKLVNCLWPLSQEAYIFLLALNVVPERCLQAVGK
jgi:hypothetical protein